MGSGLGIGCQAGSHNKSGGGRWNKWIQVNGSSFVASMEDAATSMEARILAIKLK